MLSGALKIRAVQISPVFAYDVSLVTEHINDSPFLMQVLKWTEYVDRFLFGCEHIAGGAFYAEELNIQLCPKFLQPSAGRFNEPRFFYAGRCAGEQPRYGSWRKPDDDRPIVLVSTSTTYITSLDFLRACVEGLVGLGWHVVLSLADYHQAESLTLLHEQVEAVSNVSHGWILPYANLSICGGGIISSTEAMYFGVPLLMTTHGSAELEWFADRMEDLGIGVHLRRADTTAENIKNAAIRIANDEAILTRVKQMQREVRRSPGAEEAVNRIEDYMDRIATSNSLDRVG
jgi:MGT family glycosyltransferase